MYRPRKKIQGFRATTVPLWFGVIVFISLTWASTAWAEPPNQEVGAEVSPGEPETLAWSRSGVRGMAGQKKTVRVRKTKNRRGLYLTVGTGLLSIDNPPAPYAQIDEGTGLSIGLGYRPSKNYSFEGTAWSGILDARKMTTGGGATNSTSGTLLGLMGDFKLWFPISLPRVEGYGQLGVGYMNFGAEQTPNNVVAGSNTFEGAAFDAAIGLDVRFSKQVAGGVRGQYFGILTTDQRSERVGDSQDIIVNMLVLFLTATFELD